MEKKRESGEKWFGEVIHREKELQRRERWNRIRKSKYNKWFKEVKGEGIPGYLKKG